MWKPKNDSVRTAIPSRRHKVGVMAHRRAVGGRPLVTATLMVLLVTFLLAGSVYVSNRVTGLRTEIARLESRRGFLEAGSARLLSQWNQATAPSVVIARAQVELGLEAFDDPGLALVQLPGGAAGISRWQRLLENMGSSVQAAEAASEPAMVSLTPRSVAPAGGR